MTRIQSSRRLTQSILLACVFWSPSTMGRASETQPLNIVFLYADDLGWKDIGSMGSPLHQTPNIDSLAQRGMRFTAAYSPACSCSPSRAAVMTGQYPGRSGMTAIVEKHSANNAPDDAPLRPATTLPELPDSMTTVAEVLHGAGYATALVGKWHLSNSGQSPREHGFDVAIAPPHAGAPKSYFWPGWNGRPQMEGRFDGEYLTDRLAEEACDFIDSHRDQPFFLYLPFHSVHVPIEAKQEKVEKYRQRIQQFADQTPQHNNPYYAAMVESLDEAVGQVLQLLDRLELTERTLVIFSSDNGGLVHPSHMGDHTPATNNAPLRSGKGFLYEGGIRVPLLIQWPDVAMPGVSCDVPVHGCDLFPTICEAAGVDVVTLEGHSKLDGRSLVPLLSHPETGPTRDLYWHYPHFSSMGGRPSGAVRRGDWKLIEHYETGELELYNLSDDLGETQNLVDAYPELSDQLHQRLMNWRQEMHALMPSEPNPAYRSAQVP